MDQYREPIIRFEAEGTELRLAQVTDLHLAYRYLFKGHHLRRLRRLLRSLNPDLVVNTGDLFVRRQLFSPLPLLDLYQNYVGRHWPWAFAWGNHDHELKDHHFAAVEEKIGSYTNALYASSHDFFMNLDGTLPPPGDPADANLGGNYLIEVFRKQGDPGLPAWHLFVFNSRRTEHIPAIALDWAREQTAKYDYAVPALCFFHKPIREMRLKAEAGAIDGFAYERVASGKEAGQVHQGLRAMRTVQACFTGHDHRNNYSCTVDGIRYQASRKTLSLAYGLRSGENLLRRRKKDWPLIDFWGVTRIRLSLTDGAFQAETVLEGEELTVGRGGAKLQLKKGSEEYDYASR